MANTVKEVVVILDTEISKLEGLLKQSLQNAYSKNSIRFGLYTLKAIRNKIVEK